jgi:hypothetical protein
MSDKPQLPADDFKFDYKSREMEKGKTVCVACINESRSHQIPGEYEHICGKQLPDDTLEEIRLNAKAFAAGMWPGETKYDTRQRGYVASVHEAVAKEYATKLQDSDKKIELLIKSRQNQNDWIHVAHALLSKFISRHEAGLFPDMFIYKEIKTFLDGTK